MRNTRPRSTYKNASGVRAICSDCHVPHAWGPKMIRKIQASNELWHKLMGTIDTPEKFEAKRLELATHVWETMKATDSRECRNCHSFEAMDFRASARTVARKDGAGGAWHRSVGRIDLHRLPQGHRPQAAQGRARRLGGLVWIDALRSSLPPGDQPGRACLPLAGASATARKAMPWKVLHDKPRGSAVVSRPPRQARPFPRRSPD